MRQEGMTRSEFIRKALQRALRQMKIAEMGCQHQKGYLERPVEEGEFDGWESEQAWAEG